MAQRALVIWWRPAVHFWSMNCSPDGSKDERGKARQSQASQYADGGRTKSRGVTGQSRGGRRPVGGEKS